MVSCFNPRLPGGRRPGEPPNQPRADRFQSTPSGGKATAQARHSARSRLRFNPRLPGGRRPATPRVPKLLSFAFQSTPSGGKATAPPRPALQSLLVSIHAFRGEGDKGGQATDRSPARFNPRLPGGRRQGDAAAGAERGVSIHAFRGEGDSIPTIS